MDIEQARQLAQDETTLPEILAQLARNKDYQVRKAVASNPNTPTKTLLNLGADFPEELLNNFVFSLLLLENPNLIEDLPFATKKSLLKCEAVPPSLIKWAVTSSDKEISDILFSLTINPNTKSNIIKNISNHNNKYLAESAKLHINYLENNNETEQKILTESIRSSLSRIQNDINQKIILQRLLHLKLIPIFLISLLPIQFRMSIAKNDNNPFYLEKIVDDCLEIIQYQKSECNEVKRLIYEEEKVLEGVAGNFHAPISILIKLARIYGSKSTQNSICEKAIYHICHYVAEDVRNRSHILEQFIDDTYTVALKYIAKNIFTPSNILSRLIEVTDPPYEELAKNPNAPIRIGNNNNYILKVSTTNYNQLESTTIVSKIMHDFGKSIIKKSINTTTKKSHDLEQSVKLLENIIINFKKPFSLYRLIPFFHPKISPDLLAENAYSNCWWERYAIAQNPNTPFPIVQRLAKDGNRIVRNAALAHLKII